MAIRCTKIKLKAGTELKAKEWANELNRRSCEVQAVLANEGVTIEAAFLDKQSDGYYLMYFMQSEDFKKSQDVTNASISPVEIFHREFKKSCWESATSLEELICFE
jgi:hypothetical protein